MSTILLSSQNNKTVTNLIKLKKKLNIKKYDVINTCLEQKMNDLRENIDSILFSECNHNYVNDYIDLDVDNGGKYISYCSVCFITFN
jgi:hypothetical protein